MLNDQNRIYIERVFRAIYPTFPFTIKGDGIEVIIQVEIGTHESVTYSGYLEDLSWVFTDHDDVTNQVIFPAI